MVSRGGTYSTRETAGIGAGAEVGVRAVIEVGAGAGQRIRLQQPCQHHTLTI